jgi:hypothetical protein
VILVASLCLAGEALMNSKDLLFGLESCDIAPPGKPQMRSKVVHRQSGLDIPALW